MQWQVIGNNLLMVTGAFCAVSQFYLAFQKGRLDVRSFVVVWLVLVGVSLILLGYSVQDWFWMIAFGVLNFGLAALLLLPSVGRYVRGQYEINKTEPLPTEHSHKGTS
jgi:hypothetical protein